MVDKRQIYEKWIANGQQAPNTKEEGDIILEMQRPKRDRTVKEFHELFGL